MSSILIHIPSAPRGNQRHRTGQPVFQFCLRLRAFGLALFRVHGEVCIIKKAHSKCSQPVGRAAALAQSYKSKPVMCARRENYDCGPCVHTYVLLPVCVYNSNHTERRVPMRVLITRSAHENPHTRKPKAQHWCVNMWIRRRCTIMCMCIKCGGGGSAS